MGDVREFFEELRDNWRDSYWWLDHPELRAAVLSMIAGTVGLMFYCLQLLMERRLRFRP